MTEQNNTPLFNIFPQLSEFQDAMAEIIHNYRANQVPATKSDVVGEIAVQIDDMCELFFALSVLDQPDNAKKHDVLLAQRIFERLEYNIKNPEPPYIRQIENIIRLVLENAELLR